jgi:hypothetical protein
MPRVSILALLAIMSCRSSSATRGPVEGELQVQWRDSSQVADLHAPAEAHWCARDTLLEILAVRHDSAFGLVLLAPDSLRPQAYPVFQGGVFATWRPQATAAVRLLTATELKGFTSTWGQVQLTEGGPHVSGSFDLHVKLSTGQDSLHLTGHFTRLAVVPADPSCGRANKPKTP